MAESRNTPAASTSREASHAGEANTAATEGSEQNTTAGYIAGKRGFPLVSLDQVTDEKLRRVLAQQAPAAKAQEGTVAAEAVSEVLQEAVADMGIPAQEVEPACDPELRPNGHGARTVIDPSLVPDDDLDAYREDPHPTTSSNMVTEEALTRPSQPVPMTGMIPQVPNSHAARRFGADPAAMPKTGPVSMPTNSVPLVDRGAQGLHGRGSGGRWGSRRLRSFVRTEEAAPAAPRGAQRIAQRQFVPTIRSDEHERREAFRREKEYARDTLNFTLRLAEAMFHYGADAMDVDSAIIAVSSAYGLDSVEVDITNQSVTINYTSDPDIYMESRIAKRNANADERFTHTLVRVVRSSTENYEALSEVYGLIYKITRGGMTLEIADLKLSQITHRPKPFPPLVVWAANLACAGTLTAALGASFATALSAVIIFIPVYLLIQWLSSIGIPAFFRMAASAGLMTFLAIWLGGEGSILSVLQRQGEPISAPLVVAAGMIMFLPTPRLVGAVQDAINGFPVTAAGRFVSTGMSFLGLVVGIATAVSAINIFNGPTLDIEQLRFEPTTPLVASFFFLVAIATFAITLQTKLVKVGWLMVITGCGLAAYYGYELLAGPSAGRGPTACAAVVIGALSTYFAYRLHVPQAIFSIPAITFLLPGLSFFRGMYLLTVETDVILGMQNMITAVSIVVAMASGVALGNYTMQYALQHFTTPRNVEPADS
ncbi:threonine/serine exporter family protein [uncultured Rothia sp.]|uniref:threonine/serine ThrE exporter family protein n=1 Tax=uncultured Rothia sp. TaxID=316088 RepID=UPI0028062036|nr:threonine/serine exporter family protein [uncultured Rothia sp.]